MSLSEFLAELKKQLEDLRNNMVGINARIAALEVRLDEIEKRLDTLEKAVMQRNGYMKWMIIMLGMILSFVAAMFGLGWKPP